MDCRETNDDVEYTLVSVSSIYNKNAMINRMEVKPVKELVPLPSSKEMCYSMSICSPVHQVSQKYNCESNIESYQPTDQKS